MAVDSTDLGLPKVCVVNRNMGNRPLRMKGGWIPLGEVESVWMCVVMPLGITVKKGSQKVVEGFY